MAIKELGKEYPEQYEERDTQEIINAVKKRLVRDYPPGKMLRQFHAKMHACVQATVTVEQHLPAHLQHGFLVPGKKYDAWIRYSNGSDKVVKDKNADLRGMAVKLLNVEGEFESQDVNMPNSHDFLTVTYPTLMSATVGEFKKNIIALCGGMRTMIPFALNPTNWAALVRTIRSLKKHDNLFAEQYYSVSPYRLGAHNQAIKYSIIPTSKTLSSAADKSDENFIGKTMQRDLETSTVTFDFMVQLQEDADKMPIENTCVEWKSPFIKVATIRIPSQNFLTKERIAFGEKLTYSPWHALKVHKPLGGVNRARRAAYEALAKFRLEHNSKLTQ
jgi:hypothetical protein